MYYQKINLIAVFNHLKQIAIKNSFLVRSPVRKQKDFIKFSFNLIRHSSKMPRYEYPAVRRDENIVENFHGNEVLELNCFMLNYC